MKQQLLPSMYRNSNACFSTGRSCSLSSARKLCSRNVPVSIFCKRACVAPPSGLGPDGIPRRPRDKSDFRKQSPFPRAFEMQAPLSVPLPPKAGKWIAQLQYGRPVKTDTAIQGGQMDRSVTIWSPRQNRYRDPVSFYLRFWRILSVLSEPAAPSNVLFLGPLARLPNPCGTTFATLSEPCCASGNSHPWPC